ncbi:hypothetical protein [Arthrobacter sp. CAN_C5]|uniref:hypothetical protein n=1 Tax=Arthrobacter sp. CAN_C5 TaxID=2760706 RepID=UPI001AE629FD|nr:hypothetical protein [Arthrobacter sp. CAN_C5]MBP2217017.1 hypothetical protein [Arthrobacter sp. CAN_C5]
MSAPRIFELRTDHPAPGKIGAFARRFKDHTTRIFTRMGMELVALFLPTADGDPLVDLLAFES